MNGTFERDANAASQDVEGALNSYLTWIIQASVSAIAKAALTWIIQVSLVSDSVGKERVGVVLVNLKERL
jgi:hypothetical protein